MVKVILRKGGALMSSKKDSNRVLDENGNFVAFPVAKVAQTINHELISSDALQSHKGAVEETKEERKLPFFRKEERKKNDQVKAKEKAAFDKILDS